MISGHVNTIKSHLENIEIMSKAYAWGKPAEECFAEIQKSVDVIKQRIELIKEAAA